METRFNYPLNEVTINGRVYDLDRFRLYLLRNWPALCAAHYHSAVQSDGVLRRIYDWENIFSTCRESLLPLVEFTEGYNPQETSELLKSLASARAASRLSLEQVERAVRKQFVWDQKDPDTRWATRIIDANIGLKWLGVTVFIGVAQLMGFAMADILVYLDLSQEQVETKARWFRETMVEAGRLHRKGTLRFDKTRPNKPTLVYMKSWMAVRYIRLTYRDYVSLSEFSI